MDQLTWQKLLENYGEGREFIAGGYYRLRNLGDGRYELSFILSGPCGESIYHPRIVAEQQATGILPLEAYDNHVTPIIRVNRTEDADRLDQLFQELVSQFLAAKGLE